MREEWRDVPNYEGLYQVSNLGRLKSLDRMVKTVGGGMQPKKGMVLKLRKNRGGYLFYLFSKDGNRSSKTIHRIVMEVFTMKSDLQVNHIDGDKLNNCLYNLEYCTCEENMIHRETTLKGKSKYGVTFHKRDQIWESTIIYKGESYYLGRSNNKESLYKIFHEKYFELRGKYPW